MLDSSTVSGGKDPGRQVRDPEESDGNSRLSQERLPDLNSFGGWYGRNAEPGSTAIAFVGERLAGNNPKWNHPLYGGTSGGYLWRAITLANFSFQDMYYTNAIKPLGFREDLYAEICHEVLPDYVVALGQVASERLWDSGVSHYCIPHPSYWRRFHTSEFRRYVDLLKAVMAQ